MKQARFGWPLIGFVVLLNVHAGFGGDTNPTPHFQEVFRLLRVNLPNVSEDELNRAAVEGLLSHFSPRVILGDVEAKSSASQSKDLIGKAVTYDRDYGCIRVAHVAAGLAEELAAAWQKLNASHVLKGLVLDLRFAEGDDYAAAAEAADLFQTKEQTLLSWGENAARSKSKADALKVPLAVLVNEQTAGAAEALAAVLRDTGAALLIGAKTAGQAHVFKEFELSTGQRLRIASSPVRVGEEAKPLDRVTPDVAVIVSADDEREYFADPFKVVNRSSARSGSALVSTNRTGRRRLNEAELVRMQRDGQDLDDLATPDTADEPAEPVVRDPSLVRALDLLKGIGIVQRPR